MGSQTRRTSRFAPACPSHYVDLPSLHRICDKAASKLRGVQLYIEQVDKESILIFRCKLTCNGGAYTEYRVHNCVAAVRNANGKGKKPDSLTFWLAERGSARTNK